MGIWVNSDKSLSTRSPIFISGRDRFFDFKFDKMSFVDFNNKSAVVIDGNGTLAGTKFYCVYIPNSTCRWKETFYAPIVFQ